MRNMFSGAVKPRSLLATALLMAVALSFVGTCAQASASTGGEGAERLLFVVIDRISIFDIDPETTPNMLSLIDRGSFALMNARVKYDKYGLGSYTVIGAGGRAIGGNNSGLAFNREEPLQGMGGDAVPAGSIYRALTGSDPGEAAAVNLYIEEMKKRSDVPRASGTPGVLGESLARAGKVVTVLGNADSFVPASQSDTGYPANVVPLKGCADGTCHGGAVMPHREIASIAMDASGRVATGDLSSLLYAPADEAAGVETSWDVLEEEVAAALRTGDAVFVDMGQTSRVDEQSNFYSKGELASARTRALASADASLGRMLENVDLARDLVVVVTPTPRAKLISASNLLTPLIIAGPGFAAGSQLSSPSTRRTGIVSNFDIAPTILESMGVDATAEMDGRALESRGSRSGLEGLTRTSEYATGASVTRSSLVRFYAISLIVFISLFLLTTLVREDLVSRHRFFWSSVLLAYLSAPLVYMIVPLFAVPALLWEMPAIIAACAGAGMLLAAAAFFPARKWDGGGMPLAAVPGAGDGQDVPSDGMRDGGRDGTWLHRRPLMPFEYGALKALSRPLALISGLTLAVVLVDMVFGGKLMALSAFGSDVMKGDRYYGMGNLYSGFAIGSAILFACLLPVVLDGLLNSTARRYAVSGVVLAVTAVILGFGRLGADFGGLVVMVFASLIVLIKFDGEPITARRLALAFAIVILAAALFIGADMMFPGTASHTGKVVANTGDGGISTAVSTASRKLSANWRLSASSIWRIDLFLLLFSFLLLEPIYGVARRVRAASAPLFSAFVAMALALPLAWIANDSGIEAAAALSVFVFLPLFYLLVRLLPMPLRSDTPQEDSPRNPKNL